MSSPASSAKFPRMSKLPGTEEGRARISGELENASERERAGWVMAYVRALYRPAILVR